MYFCMTALNFSFRCVCRIMTSLVLKPTKIHSSLGSWVTLRICWKESLESVLKKLPTPSFDLAPVGTHSCRSRRLQFAQW